MMWGAANLVEWLSPGHYLYLMLQTVTGYQLWVCVIYVNKCSDELIGHFVDLL